MAEVNERVTPFGLVDKLAQEFQAKLAQTNKKVQELGAAGAEPNVITAVKNNGTPLEIADRAVDIGAAIAAAVAASDHLQRKIVASLDAIDPSAEGADRFIYMVPKTGSGENDLYDEYMVLDGAVEHVGNTKVDLSGYQPKEEGKVLSSNDFTDEAKAKLDGIELATEEDYNAMIDRVFGAGTGS